MNLRKIVFALAACSLLAGCTSMPSWLGGKKTDDTILPGAKEDILPPQKLPRGNTVGTQGGTVGNSQGKLAAPTDAACEPSNANYPECLTPEEPGTDLPVDEESAIPEQ